ncbi:Polynucleotide 5'-hydroxyl-kinase grc3 [Coemansia sp. RSA 1933]|nr:Polynucleotide 5'-hydroxyl-kinase grc3 [Coemansia sp. RSA 1933]
MHTPDAKRTPSLRSPRPRRAATPTTSRIGTPVSQREASHSRDGINAGRWATATTWSSYSAENSSIVLNIIKGNSSTVDKVCSLEAVSRNEPVADRYGSVAKLPVGQSIAFQGIVDVCVISGAVSVYGYTATPECGWKRVYSPSSHPLVQITSVPCKVGSSSSRRSGRSSSSKEGDVDDGLRQIKQIWNACKGTGRKGGKQDGPVALIAFRAVNCGLEEIGVAAPPYRGLFEARPFEERVDPMSSRRNAKRKSAFSRNSSAAKIAKLSKAEDSNAMSEDYDSDADRYEEHAESAKEHGKSEELLVSAIGLPGFYPILFLTNELQLLMTPQDWVEKLDMASNAPLQLDDEFEPICPTYVLAGGQSQGKSTFSRFLLNRLLNRYGRLFYMDTDLGQSELLPPGALSVTLLSQPLLGPPFAHASHVEPYHAIYTGTTSPKGDPDRYVAAIRRLSGVVSEYTRVARSESTSQNTGAADLDRQVIPVVVNTHGWLKGLGLDLHYSLCEAVRPTTYIQLYDSAEQEAQLQHGPAGSGSDQMAPIIDFSSIPTCNPQLMWVSAMTAERAMMMLHLRSSGIAVDNQASDEEYASQQEERSEYTVESQAATTQSAAQTEALGKKNPRHAAQDMRALALVSHFYGSGGSTCLQSTGCPSRIVKNPTWDMRRPLAARRPLLVPLSEMVVWLGVEDIPPSQLLRALNGSIVGVIATAIAHAPEGRTWTTDTIRSLYDEDQSITDIAVSKLSEPGSRMLLRSAVRSHQSKHIDSKVSLHSMPQIVYGQPNMDNTTFLCHALVRSVDPINGNAQLVLPPLATDILEQTRSNLLHRIVGLMKGPGPSELGIELPLWSMLDGGYSKRAIGSSSVRARGKYGNHHYSSNLGIKEAPYLSVEADEGIGASATRSRGGQMRRALQ